MSWLSMLISGRSKSRLRASVPSVLKAGLKLSSRSQGDDRSARCKLPETTDRPPGYTAGDRQRSEEHTSELQSLMRTSYAVFCLKKKHTSTRITPPRSFTFIQR